MLAGIRGRLTYANVVSTSCLFILLGGGAWAANKINSGDVADNSLKSVDLKDKKGVKGADVAPDSLTGGAIDESTLQNVDAASLGGLQVRKINFDVDEDDVAPYETVLDFGGLVITAACRSFGDHLDVKAYSTKGSTGPVSPDFPQLIVTAVSSLNEGDTDGGGSDTFTSNSNPQEIDNMFPPAGDFSAGTLHYQAPDGSVVVAHLAMRERFDFEDNAYECEMHGMAIGG